MNFQNQKVHVVIPAGGVGKRFGGDIPKQYLKVQGLSLLERTLGIFLKHPKVSTVTVAVPSNDLKSLRAQFTDPKLNFVAGGSSRAESVKNGFQALVCDDQDLILVHDAARCVVSVEVIDRVILGVAQNRAVICATAVTDTIKKIEDDKILATVDRATLCAAQTPQGAPAHFFKKAYLQISDIHSVTDEAMLLESAGFEVFVVEGDVKNIKVTRPEDLEWIEFFSRNQNDKF